MGLFKKISDLLRANINTLLDQSENPQKLAELAIFEAEENKKKAAKLTRQTRASLNLCDARLKALKLEHEENSHNQKLTHEISELEKEKATHEQTLFILENGEKALKQHLNLLKSRATHSADYSQDTNAFDTFERIEQKIENSEAQVEAFKELLDHNAKNHSSSLEDELEELKKKLKK
jgi:phage shock protein A